MYSCTIVQYFELSSIAVTIPNPRPANLHVRMNVASSSSAASALRAATTTLTAVTC